MKLWILLAIVLLAACRREPVELETYYFQIKDVHLRIPGKYVWYFPSGLTFRDTRGCDREPLKCAQHPPGLTIQGISFQEQDFHTFEHYKEPTGFQGLSDILKIGLDESESLPKSYWLPNYVGTWNAEKRDPKNDIHGLQAYKSLKTGDDDVNYRHDFGGGAVLYMKCSGFSFPNPRCEVSEPWRGLLLRYEFTHRHLAEWQDLHQRLTNHLNSFVPALN